MEQPDIGKQIQKARKAAGLTQEEAAKRLGTTRTGYARWEGKESNPSWAKLQEIAKAFGYTCYDGDWK